MPRLMTLGSYATVFVIALIVGLLIATALRAASFPATGFAATPTAVSELATSEPPPTDAPSRPTETPAPTRPTAALFVASSLPSPLAAPATPLPAPATPLPAPPTPTLAPRPQPQPLVFKARIFDKPTDSAVTCGTSFDSRVWGVVKDKSGKGIYRAVVQVSSVDSKNRFSRTTNNQGGFEVPGLGCTTWSVRLSSLPKAPNGFHADVMSVTLNGGRYSGAGIEFRQR